MSRFHLDAGVFQSERRLLQFRPLLPCFLHRVFQRNIFGIGIENRSGGCDFHALQVRGEGVLGNSDQQRGFVEQLGGLGLYERLLVGGKL